MWRHHPTRHTIWAYYIFFKFHRDYLNILEVTEEGFPQSEKISKCMVWTFDQLIAQAENTSK